MFTFAISRRQVDHRSARRPRARRPIAEDLEGRRLPSGIIGNHIGMSVAPAIVGNHIGVSVADGIVGNHIGMSVADGIVGNHIGMSVARDRGPHRHERRLTRAPSRDSSGDPEDSGFGGRVASLRAARARRVADGAKIRTLSRRLAVDRLGWDNPPQTRASSVG